MPASRTVFEFTGSEADRDHRGSRGTFMGATLDLSNAKEERSSNLRSGPSTWIFVMVAILLTAGITAYMVLSSPKSEPTPAEEEPAAVAAGDQATPTPAAGEAKAGGSGDDTAGGSGDETAGGSGEPAGDAKAPVDDAKAETPTEAPKVEPAAKVDPPVEPTKAEPAKPSKPKSTGSKPKPKTEPKKPASTKPTLKPKKPPRDPLGNLPPPPG
jgi:hypothetical protein